MRKLTASFYISLDGVVDAPQEWHFPMVDDAMMSDVAAALEESDTILLGRATYQEWADFWPHQTASNPMASYFNSTPKLVVSTTLASADWENSTLISNDAAAQVEAAKRQSGANISVTGSGTLVRSLLGHGLVDELRLMIHPIVGRARQAAVPRRRRPQLPRARRFEGLSVRSSEPDLRALERLAQHANNPLGYGAVSREGNSSDNGRQLLRGGAGCRRRAVENVQNLRRKARERDKVQRFTFVFGEGPEPMLIYSVIVPDSGSREDLENGRRVIVTGF